MSRKEVERILGGSPESSRNTSWTSPAGTFTWEGCAGSTDVVFDSSGKVVNKFYWSMQDWEDQDDASKEAIRSNWRENRSRGIRIRE
jgi:hypothetical protein